MTSEDPQKLVQAGVAELQKGNVVAAREYFESCLLLAPKTPHALDLMAQIELSQGNVDAAFNFAQRAVTEQSLSNFIVTLAEAIKAKGDTKRAADLFLTVLKAVPYDVRALAGMGDIYKDEGHAQLAIECYRKILTRQPKNTKYAISYSKLLPQEQMLDGLAALETARPPENASVKTKFSYLSWYTLYKEWAERVRRGLFPYHITKIEELFFTFARNERDQYESAADEILAHDPNYPSAQLSKACCLVTRRSWPDAERMYRLIARSKPNSISANVEFSKEFFDKLSQITENGFNAALPAVEQIKRAEFQHEHIIYLSCNYEYFLNFTRAMLLSVNDVAKGTQVHIHIMDATPDELNTARAFCESLSDIKTAITAETTGLLGGTSDMPASNYYHSIRFIRFYTHLKAYNKTCWMMDVDALMNRDPQSLFKNIESFDTAFRARPGRMEPWNQFSACVFGVRPTEAGLKYLHLVAAYIFHFYNKRSLGWGIDQLAMYAAFEHLRDAGQAPSVYLLDNVATNMNHTEEGYVWLAAGSDKFVQVKRIAKGKDMPEGYENATYFEAFKKYSARLN